MEKRIITSTSNSSATCSDLVLRGGADDDQVRLIFKPEIVKNPHDGDAAVRGTFVYQKKGKADTWIDLRDRSLGNLKKGEGYKLELKSVEVLKLCECLNDLYKLYAKHGIPFGQTEFVRADSVIADLMEIPRPELRAYLSANETIGEKLLARLLLWAADTSDPAGLVSRLLSLGEAALKHLNVAVNLGTLKKAMAIWRDNRRNSEEEFWQQTLTEHSFVLEQVFAWPMTIVKGKAYVGGKSVLNEGGNIVDFLVKNFLTKNAALVEIKTPMTPLVGRKYRQIYNVSDELGGSVMQVLNYKYSLQTDFLHLVSRRPRFEAFEPRCVVIVGAAGAIRDDPDKLRALELYRNSCSAVTIITFDELFAKTERLINVLETAA